MASESTPQPPVKLDDDKQALFQEFVKVCEEKGYLQRPQGLGDEDITDGFNDHVTLLRFLRARAFNVEGALKQYEDALAIRNAVNAAELYDNFDLKEFEHGHRLYAHWYGCRDNQGSPLCYINLEDVDLDYIDEYTRGRGALTGETNSVDAKLTSKAAQKAMVAHDYLTRFVLPLCSAMKDRPNPDDAVVGAVVLFDVENLGFKMAWRGKDFCADFSQVLGTCHPEVLDKIYILNPPSFISMIWPVFQKVLDPGTASKVCFVPSNATLSTLQSHMSIDCIPTKYGGKFDFKENKSLEVDSGILGAFDWVSPQGAIPEGPIKWIDDANGNRAAVAVGQVGGATRREEVAVNGS